MARRRPRSSRASLRRRAVQLGRALLERAWAQLTRPLTLRVAGLLLALLMFLNWSVKRQGGDVHLLSLGRVRERAWALGLFALHQVRCHAEERQPEPLIRAAALRHRVPARLALSVARTESSLVHTRISSTGAMGLMQLMPETARELGVQDPFDAAENADAGVRYMAQLLSYYRGDARKALAAYNAGMARVPQVGAGRWPAETQAYVTRVLSGL